MLTAHLLALALQVPGWGCGSSTIPGQAGSETLGQRGPRQPWSPGDTVPANSGTPRPGPAGGCTGAPDGPRTGGASTPAAPAGPGPALPRATSMAMTSDDGWWSWWEYNKTEFLKPRRRPLSDMVLSMDGDEAAA